jgi:ABC-2 type transport system permease protein
VARLALPKLLRLIYRNLSVNTDIGTIFFVVGLPTLYLVFFGYGYQSFIPGGKSYIEFLTPGILSFQTLIAGTVAGSMLWLDRRFGMLAQLLVGPFTRLQYLLGLIITSLILGIFGGMVMLAVSSLIEPHILEFGGLILMLAAIVVGSVCYGSIMLLISALVKSQNTYNSIQVSVIFLSNFASTVFYPYSDALPLPLRFLFLANPLTYISNTVRDGYLNTYSSLDLIQFILTSTFTLFVLLLSARAYFRSELTTT